MYSNLKYDVSRRFGMYSNFTNFKIFFVIWNRLRVRSNLLCSWLAHWTFDSRLYHSIKKSKLNKALIFDLESFSVVK